MQNLNKPEAARYCVPETKPAFDKSDFLTMTESSPTAVQLRKITCGTIVAISKALWLSFPTRAVLEINWAGVLVLKLITDTSLKQRLLVTIHVLEIMAIESSSIHKAGKRQETNTRTTEDGRKNLNLASSMLSMCRSHETIHAQNTGFDLHSTS